MCKLGDNTNITSVYSQSDMCIKYQKHPNCNFNESLQLASRQVGIYKIINKFPSTLNHCIHVLRTSLQTLWRISINSGMTVVQRSMYESSKPISEIITWSTIWLLIQLPFFHCDSCLNNNHKVYSMQFLSLPL